MSRVLSVAVLVVLIAAGWLLVQMNGGQGAAFAAMLDHFQEIRTATYRLTIYSDDEVEVASQIALLEPAWMRMEMEVGPTSFVQLYDFRAEKGLLLMPAVKQANALELSAGPGEPQHKHLIEEFRKLTDESAEYVGREQVGEQSALKFLVDRQGEFCTIWIDPENNLPLKILFSESRNTTQSGSRMTMTDFAWNAPVDESLFSLEPPEGYSLRSFEVDLQGGGQEEFVGLIRFIVKLNDDEFPARFNTMTLVSIIQEQVLEAARDKQQRPAVMKKLADALNRPDLLEAEGFERLKIGMQLQQSFARGAMFLEQIAADQVWRYRGEGVRFGDSDKIVAWWHAKPDGQADEPAVAKVLYGDLRVGELQVKELPVDE
ncbi:MAG: DUF2092 domain-containing protein [Planctomycetota bacterium]